MFRLAAFATAVVMTVSGSPAVAQQIGRASLASYFDGCSDCSCAPVNLGCDAGGDCCGGCGDACDACGGCGDACGCCGGGGLAGLFECEHGEMWTLTDFLFGDCPPMTIGGWLQGGYHSAPTALGQANAFNVHPDRFNIHQAYAYLQKEADGSDGLDWGYRADFVYGVDAQDTQAFGNPPGRFDFGWNNGIYGWAIPQLYGELACGDLSVIAGHFYTLVGYEVVTAPGNFFYSHSWTMYNSEPFTHTGVLGTYKANDKVTLYGGWTLGWDTGFSQLNGGSNFLGGFGLQLMEDVALTYITTVGNFGSVGEGYGHSVVADVTLTDDWNYVLQTDMFDNDLGRETVGINQYSFYTINDCVKLGTRVEWWKADGQSHYNWTTGFNWIPCANFRLRPEYRYNWVPGFNGNRQQGVFGIDGILLF